MHDLIILFNHPELLDRERAIEQTYLDILRKLDEAREKDVPLHKVIHNMMRAMDQTYEEEIAKKYGIDVHFAVPALFVVQFCGNKAINIVLEKAGIKPDKSYEKAIRQLINDDAVKEMIADLMLTAIAVQLKLIRWFTINAATKILVTDIDVAFLKDGFLVVTTPERKGQFGGGEKK